VTRPPRDIGRIALAVLTVLVAPSSCASEEEILFGDPAKVAAGATGGSVTGGCQPDPSCAVSFEADVFPILEANGKCSSTTCHGGGTAGLTITPGDVQGAYASLSNYELSGGRGFYVVGCDLVASKLLCNLKVDPDGDPNPYDTCGSLMPKALLSDTVDDAPLTIAEVETVADWIRCGAPPP
jgi:hypothetical protein